ncbi:WhiB family transcriptional regulator [Micromonospora musae]|uniref:WhiB family transcriptional regulator n=1 Tax=Micromonospora musae TaxID=1894970 RepID=UPI0033DCB1BE
MGTAPGGRRRRDGPPAPGAPPATPTARPGTRTRPPATPPPTPQSHPQEQTLTTEGRTTVRGSWPAFTTNTRQPLACRGHDPDLWFPEKGERWKVPRARAICARCPLQPECEAWAYEQPAYLLYGIWGGTTQGQRIKRQQAASPDGSGQRHTA